MVWANMEMKYILMADIDKFLVKYFRGVWRFFEYFNEKMYQYGKSPINYFSYKMHLSLNITRLQEKKFFQIFSENNILELSKLTELELISSTGAH